MKEKLFYTPEEVAQIESVTVRTVQKWCKEGKIAAGKKNGDWLIDKEVYDSQHESNAKRKTSERVPLIPLSKKERERIINSIITFIMNKGGVGKSTCSVATCEKLALMGFKVLLVDTDSQGNSTHLAGLDIEDEEEGLVGPFYYKHTLYEVIMNQVHKAYGFEPLNFNTRDAIYESPRKNFYVLPCDFRSETLKYWIQKNLRKFKTIDDAANAEEIFHLMLKFALNEIKRNFDMIVIDTPPELGWATESALACTDYAIIPIELGRFELKGLARAMQFIERSNVQSDNNASVLGIAISRYGPIDSSIDEYLLELIDNDINWKDLRFKNIIKKGNIIREATLNQSSFSDAWNIKLSKTALASLDKFTNEIVERLLAAREEKLGLRESAVSHE